MNPVRLEPAGCAQDERNAQRPFEEVHLVPQATLAQHFPVIGGDQDHGVVAQPEAVEGFEQLPDAVVDVGDLTVIGVSRRRSQPR